MAKKPMKMKKMAKKPAPKMAAKKPTATTKAWSAASKPMTNAEKMRVPSKPRNGSSLSYTQSEFIENVRAFCGLMKRSEAKTFCEDMALLIKESMRRGYKIPLLGLGKLYVRESKARTGRNPATGQLIQIPAKKRVRFAPTKALKEEVLRR